MVLDSFDNDPKNNRNKGMFYEKKYKKLLEDKGFVVQRARPQIVKGKAGKWITIGGDFFKKFDLIAIRHDAILFIQVTTATSHTHTNKDIVEFANKIKNKNITYILARYDKNTDTFQEFIYKYS